ncbi:malate dehydrogenase (oxaloacetate-decarboxylating) [Schwartzia succinivorans DSM 10502]|jgi:malate dehydrogenase (oxaloacetate-decarboxylating)|uniref:Malate dehydrogenase (Oxaloacetate-decarboxylating) n=1 Tax=Schwartzia succinivorans DSM 10502 TaxID=1123243 RepID=A0A1M5ARR4_9FIRM|nr:malate dehydrogenase (oxaloacetate-decarboxylating) [Schwartzia succinivorans DSM 10502]
MMNLNEESLKVHREHNGKLATIPKAKLEDAHDLSVLYTPGVAEPCRKIKDDKDLSFEYTCRGNMVAVVSDGTRVLGLGNIGPEAGIPVMEGKSVLYKVFADVDAIPVCLDTSDKDKFIETVRYLQPNFAGINLEDIESPKCYDIEDALIEKMDIPVFHDDQHGTAIACAAALLGALRLVKKDIAEVKIVANGAGAAGTAIVRLLLNLGAKHITMINSKGAMYEGMDMSRINRVQAELLKETNLEKKQGSLADIAKGADVILGVSKPGVFTADIIKNMNKDAIVLAMANPDPETSYADAKAAGARVVGTGRSDAPNQVNNVLVFPGLFRGAIDVRARKINDEMKKAAVYAIANLIPDEELREDYVIPGAFDPNVAPAVAAAVAKAAMDTGVARIKVDPEDVRKETLERTKKLREILKTIR